MAQRVIFGCSDSVAQQAVQLSEFAELAPSRRPMQRWEWREGPFKQGWIILAADDLGGRISWEALDLIKRGGAP